MTELFPAPIFKFNEDSEFVQALKHVDESRELVVQVRIALIRKLNTLGFTLDEDKEQVVSPSRGNYIPSIPKLADYGFSDSNLVPEQYRSGLNKNDYNGFYPVRNKSKLDKMLAELPESKTFLEATAEFFRSQSASKFMIYDIQLTYASAGNARLSRNGYDVYLHIDQDDVADFKTEIDKTATEMNYADYVAEMTKIANAKA